MKSVDRDYLWFFVVALVIGLCGRAVGGGLRSEFDFIEAIGGAAVIWAVAAFVKRAGAPNAAWIVAVGLSLIVELGNFWTKGR